MRAACPGDWLIWGDFNLIYQAADKNNDRLNRRMMNAFRRFISDAELHDLQLKGRRFTWSNERAAPTLARLDRVLVSEGWMLDHPDHELSALSSCGTEAGDQRGGEWEPIKISSEIQTVGLYPENHPSPQVF